MAATASSEEDPAATATATTNNNNNNNKDDNESTENLLPWKNRWENRRIGFHLTEVNHVLQKHSSKILPSSSVAADAADPKKEDSDGADDDKKSCPVDTATAGDDDGVSKTRVFVPLCGKTVDMAYLVSEHSAYVVGVEGIDMALEEFANEHPTLGVKKITASPDVTSDGEDNSDGDGDGDDKVKNDTTTKQGKMFDRYVGTNIELLKGDYFELDDTVTGGKFDIIYDRASLVAIEPKLRQAYVDVQGNLLRPGGKILLAVLERRGTEEGMKMGPPYSVPESAVQDLFGSRGWCDSITMLEQTDQLERKPEDKKRYPDLDQLLETVYLIQRKEEDPKQDEEEEHQIKKRKIN
eukprot:CAMPEP_0113482328 /NCGR_PEP_ID=MMETSP0014_2-20120614/22861_1 /TAXON_ID=2857 /ORGANISM="Nitzschia sp." /LENGTH=351 /DNA_ID=CAMNT_0000375839 /DNA_START=32 /DNA_END=1087 /DNA_ORIENTATION=- /assembly_acc=CAM_ASM_000159